MSALCFLPLMIRAIKPVLCFGNILFPLAECGASATKNISERRKGKLRLLTALYAVIPALCFGNILFPLAECG